MKNLISSFLNDETAATAIEYGLIAAGISVAIIAAVQGLGSKLNYDLRVGLSRAQVTESQMMLGLRLLAEAPIRRFQIDAGSQE